MQLINIYNYFIDTYPDYNFKSTFDSLNNNSVTYQKPIIVAQFEKATPQMGFITYNFTVGYVDRIDGSQAVGDPLEVATVQSLAIKALEVLVDKLNTDADADWTVSFGDITPFQQRFDALTAGCYFSVNITVPSGCAI